MHFALGRLGLPSSYDSMVHSVRVLQKACLELDAMLRYSSTFLPRMQDPNSAAPDTPTDFIMGAFTGDAQEAHLLQKGGIPFLFVR
ncbi:hypothetical protein DFH08DRAFT_658305, partial [Mycena albidolilacea]